MTGTITLNRVAALAAIAKRWPKGNLGRTALVKCAYFLQTLKKVPLNYHFRLYSYGPFDSNVLDDLDVAESLGAVKVSTTLYIGGYSYDIQPNDEEGNENEFEVQYSEQLNWLVDNFGKCSASQLELDSTIVFVNRDGLTDESLIKRVREVKPHFSITQIEQRVEALKNDKLLSV